MNVLGFTALLFSGAAAAGLVGALTGLGGGVVLVPLLTLGLGVDIKYAIGTALVAVIATSSGAAAAYVREGFSNVRIGLFFEIATTIGALLGAYLAACPFHENAVEPRRTAPKITAIAEVEVHAARYAPRSAPRVVAISKKRPIRTFEKPSRT